MDSEKYDTKDDFTVVIQPFFLNVELPRDVIIHIYLVYRQTINVDVSSITQENNTIDYSYFAPDCFHFSTKGHKEVAVALWNNMVCVCEHVVSVLVIC